MICTWNRELMKRASEVVARGDNAPATNDAQKVIDELPPDCREASYDCAERGAVHKPARHAAGIAPSSFYISPAAIAPAATCVARARRDQAKAQHQPAACRPKIYHLSRDSTIDQPNQVWATDVHPDASS